MRTPHGLIVMCMGAAIIAACDHRSPTDPAAVKEIRANSGGPPDSGTARDTSHHTPPDTSHHTPPDTLPHPGPTPDTNPPPPDSGTMYHGPVNLTVTVVSYLFGAAGPDSVTTRAVPNALVQAITILPFGMGTIRTLGYTNASGVLSGVTVPAGAYQLRATPQGGGEAQAGSTVVVANQPNVSAEIIVPTPPPGS